jgi:hypothetical protein
MMQSVRYIGTLSVSHSTARLTPRAQSHHDESQKRLLLLVPQGLELEDPSPETKPDQHHAGSMAVQKQGHKKDGRISSRN